MDEGARHSGLRGRGKTGRCDGQSTVQEREQPHVEDPGCDWKWWKVEIKREGLGLSHAGVAGHC